MVRDLDLWRTGFAKNVTLSLKWKSEEVMDGESGGEKVGWDKHEEVKLVHEVKMEVYSRDEARHPEKSDLWP